MNIEKLIEKEVLKLDLPDGFSKPPEYKVITKKRKNGETFKKKKIYLSKIGA